MSASDNNNTDITIPCEICNRQVLFEDLRKINLI